MMLGEFLRSLPERQVIAVKWPFPDGCKEKAILFKGNAKACRDTCGLLLSLSEVRKAQKRPDGSIAILTQAFHFRIPKRNIFDVRGEVS